MAASLIIFSLFLSTILQRNAKNQTWSKATTLIEIINSVGDYTRTHIQPELVNRLEAEFLPEFIPNFAAREIFKSLRQKPNYTDFFYKDAVLNPFNSEDLADSFETELIEKFKAHQNRQELSGFRSIDKGDLFYLARPIIINQPSCLECHGEPSSAPSSLVARYGSSNGFGWKLNEIVGTQIISLPTNQAINQAHQSFFLIMGIIALLLVAVIYISLTSSRL
ncbi:MAG: DUF3365 domain-containing protein [Cyanobacteria bacterium J06642_3]